MFARFIFLGRVSLFQKNTICLNIWAQATSVHERKIMPMHEMRFIILSEPWNPPRICEFSRPFQTSYILVQDFALVDRVLTIQNGRHKTLNTRD